MEIQVINQAGKKLEKIELSSDIFSAKVNPGLFHEVVRMYQANQRRGTASAKTRAEVRGSGKKPWRQKGTGRARVGSKRTPVWRGGGVVFGPKPRDYSYTMPRKKLKLALRGILTDKLNNKEIMVIDKIELSNPKTKEMAEILKKLNLEGRVAIVLGKSDEKIRRAGQNIPALGLIMARELNTYDVLLYNKLIITRDAIPVIEERLASAGARSKERKPKKGKYVKRGKHGSAKSS